MRARILITVVAWLLGAATATGGCLLAVSLLGAGFGVTGSSGQQLTTAGVAKALAAAERGSASPPAATPSRAARARHPRAARPTPTPTQTQTSSPTPTATTPTPAQSTTPAGTPFSSQGGTVVANCLSGGAHLITWSPAQGYEVSRLVRGPAPVASVGFESNTTELTMNISCQGGTPVESTTGGH